jgi:peptide/nickel transport system substrate-binding protein/oligopeptide transport system substrate-binding protein
MPVSMRRFVPHMLVGVMLILALTAGGVALAMGVGTHTAKAGVVVLHYSNEGTSDLTSLDPARGYDLNARQAAQIIFGGLTRFGPDFRVLPDVASGWTISNRGRTYTFHLRPNVEFADGAPVTARDVAYSLNRTLSPRFASHSGAFILSDIVGAREASEGKVSQVRGIQVLNARTIRIHLRASTGSFLAKLATPAGYIVPSQLIRRDPAHWDRHAFGTGPFMVSKWIPHTGLLLAPNPHYWGGKLKITGIEMPFIPEPLTAFKRYRAGALDTMGSVHFPADALPDVQFQPDFHRVPRLDTLFLTLNEATPPFNSMKVRQAFARAVNKALVARDVFDNFAHPTNAMVPPGIQNYHPDVPLGYDPQLARKLLAQAGYPDGRGLPPVSIAIDESSQNAVLANELAQQWGDVLGVNVTVIPYPHKSYLSVLDQRAYQVAAIDWTADYPDPQNFLSQQLDTGSPNNNGGYSNPAFDRLTARADEMPLNNPERFTLYHQAELLAMQQAATIPLVNQSAGILLRQGVQGLSIAGGQLIASDWTKVTVTRSGTS